MSSKQTETVQGSEEPAPSNEHGGEVSRRNSAFSGDPRENRKRSRRRRQRGTLAQSLPSGNDVDDFRRNALKRFNSLTLDEQIALKLASKEGAGENDFDSVTDEENACEDKNPPTPLYISIEQERDCKEVGQMQSGVPLSNHESSNGMIQRGKKSCDSEVTPENELSFQPVTEGETSTTDSREKRSSRKLSPTDKKQASEIDFYKESLRRRLSEESVPSKEPDTTDSYGERLRRKLSGGSTGAIDSYEERLRRKLSGGSSNTEQASASDAYGESSRCKLSEGPSTDAGKSETWTCSKCTYVNKSRSLACEICANEMSLPGVYFVPSTASKPNTWQCKKCTFKDNEWPSLVCKICNEPMKKNTDATSDDYSTCEVLHEPEWECQVCTYKRNNFRSHVCEMCSEPKENSVSPFVDPCSVPQSASGWQCKACTYHNTDNMTTFCGICGASRV